MFHELLLTNYLPLQLDNTFHVSLVNTVISISAISIAYKKCPYVRFLPSKQSTGISGIPAIDYSFKKELSIKTKFFDIKYEILILFIRQ